AEEWGIRHFSVFHAGEAMEVRAASREDSDILILGHLTDDELAWAVETGVSFQAFDARRLRWAEAAARKTGRAAKVHLELETGMNRTGLDTNEFLGALDRIAASEGALVCEGVTTHYAGAESEGNFVRIREQIDRYRKALELAAERGVRPRIRHTACSAATFAYPETRMDLVRTGIVTYGFWPSQETRMRYLIENSDGPTLPATDPLRRVMRWVTRVMTVRDVPPGRFVGYGRTYLTTRMQRIATVPVGYAVGFPRVLSNLGVVLVNGQRAPVVGLVNMNLTTIDVTEIPGVAPGDEVVLIGSQGDKEITVGWFGDMTQTLNYEVLVRIPREVPRVIHPGME
ncbi:alanine racemase, partial [bacterium]|nr:alanine racemase [bacterium]